MLDRAFETFKSEPRPADADHRRQPHRLRRADKQDTARGARRAARRGGDRGSTKRVYGWPEDAQVPGPRRRARALRGGHRRARRATLREAWMALFERVPGRASRARRPARPDAAPRAARRLGPGPARRSRADAKGMADARGLGQGAERDRPERALAARRRGRPRALDQDAA